MFCLIHAFNPFWEKLYQNPEHFLSVIPRGVPLLHSNALQYYVKREKCKVNDVIFPSSFEARSVNLGSKNMKISFFTGGTSVRSKNIFTDISRCPTGKHEINRGYLFFSLKDRNLFHRVDTIGNIFTSDAAMSENITDGVHEMK